MIYFRDDSQHPIVSARENHLDCLKRGKKQFRMRIKFTFISAELFVDAHYMRHSVLIRELIWSILSVRLNSLGMDHSCFICHFFLIIYLFPSCARLFAWIRFIIILNLLFSIFKRLQDDLPRIEYLMTSLCSPRIFSISILTLAGA